MSVDFVKTLLSDENEKELRKHSTCYVGANHASMYVCVCDFCYISLHITAYHMSHVSKGNKDFTL